VYIGHHIIIKCCATDRLFHLTRNSESWYLGESEDESEEGLDDNMMAYVHQAKEILIKFVSDLLQATNL
jgi:hypothetical protein